MTAAPRHNLFGGLVIDLGERYCALPKYPISLAGLVSVAFGSASYCAWSVQSRSATSSSSSDARDGFIGESWGSTQHSAASKPEVWPAGRMAWPPRQVLILRG